MDNVFFKTELQINHYRHSLPDKSPLALAIDRNDSWVRIARLASFHGHDHFAKLLIQAQKKLAPNSPIKP